VKSKESNFKGAGLGETQFGGDTGEGSDVVRGFTCFDQGFVQDSLPAFFTEQLGLDLGQSDQGELPEFLGQDAFPSRSPTFFATSIK